MFFPLELVNEICAHLPNRDLINMARVCRNWHPTCVRHLSTHLDINVSKSFQWGLQLVHSKSHGQHHDIPKRRVYVTSVKIVIDWLAMDWNTSSTTNAAFEFAVLYELLDQVRRVRRLELRATLSTDHLRMMDVAYREIYTRLPYVRHLTLSSHLTKRTRSWSIDHACSTIYGKMVGYYQLKTLKVFHDYPFNGAMMLTDQASSLVELDMPLLAVVHPAHGFRVALFPCVKRLSLRWIGALDDWVATPAGDGQMLDLGTVFPSLESLYMDTIELWQFGGEELGSLLYKTSACLDLKRLELNMSHRLKVLPSTMSITFEHLETLILRSREFKEAHLQFLASVQWPSLTFLWYCSDSIYPNAVLCLLQHIPRLKWLTVGVPCDPKYLVGLVEMFGHAVWPNLQGVCITNWNRERISQLPKRIRAMQRACPNASIHIMLGKGNQYDSRLFYGKHLSPQCSKACDKCSTKYKHSVCHY